MSDIPLVLPKSVTDAIALRAELAKRDPCVRIAPTQEEINRALAAQRREGDDVE